MTGDKENLPTVAETQRDEVLALPTGDGASSIAEQLSALRAGMEQAVAHMGADDMLLECDATPSRLHLRFRAYKNKRP